MYTFSARSLPLRRKMVMWSETVQLVALRQVIRLSRTARKTRLWAETLKGYLWLPPVAFLLGMVSAHLSR